MLIVGIEWKGVVHEMLAECSAHNHWLIDWWGLVSAALAIFRANSVQTSSAFIAHNNWIYISTRVGISVLTYHFSPFASLYTFLRSQRHSYFNGLKFITLSTREMVFSNIDKVAYCSLKTSLSANQLLGQATENEQIHNWGETESAYFLDVKAILKIIACAFYISYQSSVMNRPVHFGFSGLLEYAYRRRLFPVRKPFPGKKIWTLH